MAILLSMTTMIYGMNVARSIIQEKTSRIFEVMLAIARPGDMLAGKLIGVGAVGLTQIAIWLAAGAVLLISPLAAAMLTGDFTLHFTWTEAVLFPVYFVLGYLLYSSLFAGLAATCETEQELQMYIAAGCGAHVAELCTDHADPERLEFILVGRGIAVSAYRADCDVPAHGSGDSASVAVCSVDRFC